MKKQKIIIANWKMSLTLIQTLGLAKRYRDKFKDFKLGEVVICCSTPAIADVAKLLKKTNINLGAQNVFWEEIGPFTGEVSPLMLIELGCRYVIIGHSERRNHLFENYEMVNKKIKTVLKTEKLIPVVCIGESWQERKTDKRDYILVEQLQLALAGINVFGNQTVIIAYEPIWAIGTGTAIEPTEAEYAHKIIRLALNDLFNTQIVSRNFKIIYGGSIASGNVKSFVDLENMDGLLVGGASLDAVEFYKIAKILTK